MGLRVIFFSVVLALPMCAEAATAPRTFRELAALIVDLLGAGVATLLALALVIYLWGIASNMTKLGEERDHGAWKTFIVWGLVIIFVMVSIWGILNLLHATFFEGENVPSSVVLDIDPRYMDTYVS